MTSFKPKATPGMLVAAAVLAIAACGDAPSTSLSPSPSPSPSPSTAVPSASAALQTAAPPAEASPQDSGAPLLSSMVLADRQNKRGVPVDLHYQFDGAVVADRPIMLHIAAVPRATGMNLTVDIRKELGISAVAGETAAQKPRIAVPFRQQFRVTRFTNGPSGLSVLVTMEMPEGTSHGWFNIPFNGVPAVGRRLHGK